jgi:hypothetical protein
MFIFNISEKKSLTGILCIRIFTCSEEMFSHPAVTCLHLSYAVKYAEVSDQSVI